MIEVDASSQRSYRRDFAEREALVRTQRSRMRRGVLEAPSARVLRAAQVPSAADVHRVSVSWAYTDLARPTKVTQENCEEDVLQE